MKALKFMITGALLILLGPLMFNIDIDFDGFMIICWFIGVPLFLVGLLMPTDGFKIEKQSDDLPQKICPDCGKSHDFDFPKCPHCDHDYQARPVR